MQLERSKIIEHIENLDLYIVSHGGVSSNYLVDYLELHNLNVKNNNLIGYQNSCHLPYKVVEDIPTLYIYGDVKNSIISQYRRNFLHVNATKIHLERDYDHEELSFFLKKFPKDPIGIKKQYENFKNTRNTHMLRYPFTKEELKKALRDFNINLNLDDFIIKKRKTSYLNMKIEDVILLSVLNAYDYDVFSP